MEKRSLGSTGFQVSPLGFGCAPAAFLKHDLQATATLIRELLDQGVNLIDTATMYPGSEEFIGNHLSDRRNDFVLVSKVGAVKAPGTTGNPWSVELINSSIDRGLRLMKTDHIDVMLLHSCELPVLQAGEAFDALVKARDQGKLRFIGYSGDNDAAVFAGSLPELSVIETTINFLDQANIDRLLPLAKANNIGIIAKRPVANAAWIGTEAQKGIYVNYTKEYVRRLAAMDFSPAQVGFTTDQWAELALRFTLSFPEVSTAIVGTTRPANALANLETAGKPPLDPAVVKYIRDKFHNAPDSATWAGQT